MVIVFFFYGLAFFLMGFAVLNYPKRGSSFFLARKMHFIAWFGVIHGINEWLDMFILIRALEMSAFLELVRMITLPGSFLCLIYFGTEVISSHKSKYHLCKFITPGLLMLWAGVFFLGDHSGVRWDIWSRYLLCFPGATLTGIALWLHVPEIELTDNSKLAFNLKVAGSAFIIYGLLAGLVVPDGVFFPASVLNYSFFSSTIGIPVQIFRTLCAAMVAYHLIRVLSLFQWETQQSLFNCEYRFKTVVDTAPVVLFIADSTQKITFIDGRGMESLSIKSMDVINKPIAEVFSDIPQIRELAQKAMIGEEFTSTVSFGKSHFELFLGPFKTSQGAIHGVIGIAVDVTQQKTARAQMDKYRYDMEKNKALAAIGALSTEIANDMFGPLHESKVTLLKASSGLRNSIGAQEVKEDIKKAIERLSTAIEKLDSFCNKANLKKPLEAQPIEVHEITQRILSVFQEAIQRVMLKITTAGTNILPVMYISSRELEQIIYAMMQNVIQSADGVNLHRLEIDFSIQDKYFCMKFSEYCPGSSSGSVENIPTPERTAFPDKDKYSFELSVMKGITEAYGGVVTISPNSQGGLVYEIRIPVSD